MAPVKQKSAVNVDHPKAALKNATPSERHRFGVAARERVRHHQAPASKAPLIIGGILALVALIFVGIFLMIGNKPAPVVDTDTKAAPTEQPAGYPATPGAPVTPAVPGTPAVPAVPVTPAAPAAKPSAAPATPAP